MPFISYAQNMEDVLLWRALRDVNSGFYIDVGAADPWHDSVTLAFYKRGWRGVNVDPEADNIAALSANRPRDTNLQLAVAAKAGSARFFRFPGTGWSTLDREIAGRHIAGGYEPEEEIVELQTLAAICEQHVSGEIHFLKIDVEGWEAEVLASGDFRRFRPWIVVIEATEPNSSKPVARVWEPALSASGYKLAQFDGLNCYYVAEEHAELLLPRLLVPVNVFDDYVAVRQLELAQVAVEAGVRLPGLATVGDLDAAKLRVEASERRAKAAEADAERVSTAAALELKREEQRVAEAMSRARMAEQRMLSQETEIQLLRAEAASETAATPPKTMGAMPVHLDEVMADTTTLFFDATLVLRYGFLSPVGIVRVEHYVAEFLARDPALELKFVIYDNERNAYRSTTAMERHTLEDILFRRYGRDAADLASGGPPESVVVEAAAEIGVEAPSQETSVAVDDVASQPDDPLPIGEAGRFRSLRDRLRIAASMTPSQFDEILSQHARRHLPISPDRSGVQRAGTRLVRRLILAAARGGHRGLAGTAALRGRLTRSINRLIVPDPAASDTAAPDAASEVEVPDVAAPDVNVADTAPLAPVGTTDGYLEHDYSPFQPGDVLVSMSNTWDYMDYRYLAQLTSAQGVRFLCVLYDVVGMELPFVTPAPAHHYHRHWIEIGHSSERLLAISKYTAESYDRFIARPNDIDVPVEYALLPNFLKERASEIGQKPVRELEGHEFVVYCSTIEVRKNHVLLLHLWEELRTMLPPGKLPILVFVGKWGWSAENVRLLAERNWRLRTHLKILNEISDPELIWLYRHARFTVFPSLTEGFGLAASESLSFGTPVIISHCPALCEATEELMPAFHPHDFMGWLRELERLILDDDHLGSLREAAKRFQGPPYAAFAEMIRDAALASRTARSSWQRGCSARVAGA